jgi:hypothetical protein
MPVPPPLLGVRFIETSCSLCHRDESESELVPETLLRGRPLLLFERWRDICCDDTTPSIGAKPRRVVYASDERRWRESSGGTRNMPKPFGREAGDAVMPAIEADVADEVSVSLPRRGDGGDAIIESMWPGTRTSSDDVVIPRPKTRAIDSCTAGSLFPASCLAQPALQ